MRKQKSLKPKRPIEQYDQKGKDRTNNPPVGLVTPDSDKDLGKKTYSYYLFSLIVTYRVIREKVLSVCIISGLRKICEKRVNVIWYESAMVEEV
jgi:hypothetical protein